jgi:flagellar basal-body rod protein FlgB
MFINEISNSGALPSLELMARFAAERQRIIAGNIANATTPDYRPMDVSTAGFQRSLGEAIDERRGRTGGQFGELNWRQTQELRRGPSGQLSLRPRTPQNNILFHDRNNRDLERLMQDSAENVGVFRVATDLLRNQHELLRAAIGERA